MSEQQRPLTPEAAKAMADAAIAAGGIPKKIPEMHDIEAQTKALGGALASALLTATEIPLHVLQPVVGDLAAQMVALGIRQTEHVDPTALHAPSWITDGVRQQSVKLPEQADHTGGEPVVVRTAVAPEPPDQIPEHARAVRK